MVAGRRKKKDKKKDKKHEKLLTWKSAERIVLWSLYGVVVCLAFLNFARFMDADVVIYLANAIFTNTADKYSTHPYIRNITTGIVGTSSSDYAKAVKIHNWLEENVHYMDDPVDASIFYTPIETLEKGYGDCEDIYTTLPLSMLRSVGVSGCVAIHASEKGAHAYAIAFTEEGMFRMDYGTIDNQSECAG